MFSHVFYFSITSFKQFSLFKNVLFIFERERVRKRGRGVEREGTEDRNRLCTVSSEPNVGLELSNCEITTWAEVKHSTNWATQVPCNLVFLMAFENGHLKIVLGERSKILFSKMISLKHFVHYESPTLKTQSCWINIFSERFNCYSTQIKKITIVNFYIFKNVWFSNGALYVKYNKRALTKTTYTKTWFMLSHNIYGILLLWVHSQFVNL